MIKVKFYTLLRLHLKVPEISIVLEKGDINDVLRISQKQLKKKFLHKLVGKDGSLIRGTNILLNGKNILHLNALETKVKDDDEVALFPPGGGG